MSLCTLPDFDTHSIETGKVAAELADANASVIASIKVLKYDRGFDR
jgi:hypothetical protein